MQSFAVSLQLLVINIVGAALWACILWHMHPQLAWSPSHVPRWPHRLWCHTAQANPTYHEELAVSASDPLWLCGVWMPSGHQAWTASEPPAGILYMILGVSLTEYCQVGSVSICGLLHIMIPSVLFAVSALTLSVSCQEEHPACKNWVTRGWCRYLSQARCGLFACGPADIQYVYSVSSRLHNQLGLTLVIATYLHYQC